MHGEEVFYHFTFDTPGDRCRITTIILCIILAYQCEEKLLCRFHFLNGVIRTGIIPFFTANLNRNFVNRF